MLPAGRSSVRWLEEMHAANQYSVMVRSEVLEGIDLLMLPRAQRYYDIESYCGARAHWVSEAPVTTVFVLNDAILPPSSRPNIIKVMWLTLRGVGRRL